MNKRVMLSIALFGAISAFAGMDRTKFIVGTYRFGDMIPGFRTEQHVKELKDAGIDCVYSMRPGTNAAAFYATMDLFEKYGVGCITESGADIGAGCPVRAYGSAKKGMPMRREVYEDVAKRFRPHPAIWGIDVGDEPNGMDMQHVGKAVEACRELFPVQMRYVNLLPSYARAATNTASIIESQLGSLSYKDYIDDYCKYVPLDYISFDIYPYAKLKPKGVPILFENLRIVSDACLRTGKSLWFVGQANTWWGRKPLAENCMRYQAYTAMAFGAETMVWACWTKGWWTNNVYSTTGEKTVTYDRVKRVNAELHFLGDKFMLFRRTATHLVGYAVRPEYLKGSGCISEDAAFTGWFRDIRAEDGGPLLVAEMVPRAAASGSAIFVFASDDPYDEHPQQRTIRFIPHGDTVRAFGGSGPIPVTRGDDGVCTISLGSNNAALVVAR